METEMIDKLFLELSQVTKAKTKKELELEMQNEDMLNLLKNINLAQFWCSNNSAKLEWSGDLLEDPEFVITFKGTKYKSFDLNQACNLARGEMILIFK